MTVPGRQQRRTTGLHRFLLGSLKKAAKQHRKRIQECRIQFSEKAVHDLRVEIRRLLALVDLIGVFLPERPVKKGIKLLKQHLDALDELRDAQVQALRVGRLARHQAGARSYLEHLTRREQRAVRKTAKAIRDFRPGRIRKLIERFREGIRTRAKQGLEEGDWARLRQSVLSAFAEATRLNRQVDVSDTRTIHRTRIAFKNYRYMIETVSPWLNCASRRQLRTMQQHQTLMGNVQDLEVLMAGVRRFLAKQDKHLDEIRALLARLEVQRQAAIAKFLAAAGRLSEFAPNHLFHADPASP
jgi:CHAD domain-containing protein